MTNAPMIMPTRRVEMWFAGRVAQNRLTVAFRLILAIPQFIVLYILFIAFFFVMVIGWFAALFTGRLPEWAHTFLGGVIRWYTRVGAYVFLLTDRYPPFSLDDVEYPVRPFLPGRGPLNRVSVFFRIILAIPAAVFSEIVLNGLTFPLLFFMWIAVLVRGSLPAALYDAYAALLRYQTRLVSWFSMLTSEYAWGMLGDFVPLPPARAHGATARRVPGPAGSGTASSTAASSTAASSNGASSNAASSNAASGTDPGSTVGLPDHVGRSGRHAGARGRPRGSRAPRMAATAARPTDRSPPSHAAPLATGAHVDPALAGSAAPVGHPRPAGGSAGLDDLRHRLGLDHLRRPERRPGHREQQQHQQPFDVR